jgi:hypothetical protein
VAGAGLISLIVVGLWGAATPAHAAQIFVEAPATCLDPASVANEVTVVPTKK